MTHRSKLTTSLARAARNGAALLTVAALAAACGGESGPSSKELAAKLDGPPIRIMVVAPVDTPLQNNPGVEAGARAAANAINADGGVNGSAIEIQFCNDESNPNKIAACARKAKTEKVAAVVSYEVFGASLYPTLEEAKIPNLGAFVSTTPDWTSPMSFPIFPGANQQIAAMPFQLKAHGKKKVAGVVFDLAGTKIQIPSLQEAAKKAGIEYAGTVLVPTTATDYAPYAQQVKALGADSGAIILNQSGGVSLIRAASQAGLDITWIAQNQQIGKAEFLDPLGDLAEGFLSPSGLPPVTATKEYPGIAQFNDEIKAAEKAGVEGTDDIRLTTMGPWLAIHALAIVGKDIDGPVTNVSLVDALNKAKDVDLLGLVSWSPSVAGPAAFPRLSNGKVFFTETKDGDFREDTKTPPIDIFETLGLS